AEQVCVGFDRREVADMPVERPRIVDAEAGSGPAGRVVELPDQVTSRAAGVRVEAGRLRVPETESFVVLRGGHDVAGTGTDELADEGIRVESRRIPALGEVFIRRSRPVLFLMPLPGRAA